MRLSTLLVAVPFALGACSGSGSVATETAGNAVYNAAYAGAGTIQAMSGGLPIVPAAGGAQQARVTLTLSQLGPAFSGTMTVIPTASLTGLTGTRNGSVTGRVTSTGGTLSYVPVPGECEGALYGSFALQGDGTLTGSLQGRDCTATAPGDNIRITFAGLVRQ
ncbi:MAG TPA: hypothetical protein VGT98_11670 [Candidatus Elarobacter sp.]|nr:hypothetical protein [Candidatus Elarobacter sp.]